MQVPKSQSDASTQGLKTSARRTLFLRSALASAVLMVLGGAYLSATDQAMATLSPPPTEAAHFAGPPSFAEIATRVTPAVVNVSVTQERTSGAHPRMGIPQLPQSAPFGEFFERFFREGAPLSKGFDVPRTLHGQGSGFIIDPDGYIVTNNHVVDGASEVEVLLNDGRRYTAQVRGRDSKTDLALLKIDADEPLPYLEFGSSAQVVG